MRTGKKQVDELERIVNLTLKNRNSKHRIEIGRRYGYTAIDIVLANNERHTIERTHVSGLTSAQTALFLEGMLLMQDFLN